MYYEEKTKKASLPKDKVAYLCQAENTPCADTLSTLEYLTELARNGECQEIAFGAFLKGGKFAHGYTGAVIDKPFTTVGVLSQVIFDVQINS